MYDETLLKSEENIHDLKEKKAPSSSNKILIILICISIFITIQQQFNQNRMQKEMEQIAAYSNVVNTSLTAKTTGLDMAVNAIHILEAKIITLTSQLESVEGERDNLQESVALSAQEIIDLGIALSQSQANIKTIEDAYSLLETEFATITAKLETLAEAYRTLEAEHIILIADAEETLNQLTATLIELSSTERDLENTKDALSDANIDLAETETLLTVALLDNADLENELTDYKGQVRCVSRMINDYNSLNIISKAMQTIGHLVNGIGDNCLQ